MGNPIRGRKKATKKIGIPICIKIIENKIDPIRVMMPIKIEVESLIWPHAIENSPFMFKGRYSVFKCLNLLTTLFEPSC